MIQAGQLTFPVHQLTSLIRQLTAPVRQLTFPDCRATIRVCRPTFSNHRCLLHRLRIKTKLLRRVPLIAVGFSQRTAIDSRTRFNRTTEARA
jgi:hypothetical protein